MSTDKKSFLLYCDIIHTVNKLSNEQAGELFKHLLSYVNDENPTTDDIIIELAFEPIKQSLKRDLKKYEYILKKRSEAGKRSAEIRQQKQHMLTHVDTCQQSSTNSTVSDSDSDSVSDSVSEINNKKLFEDFRILFKGTKRGLDVEYKDFQKHKDYKNVIHLLKPALVKEIEHKLKLKQKGEFVPQWKNLKTWLHQRCWEQEFEEVSDINKAIDELRGFYDKINNSNHEDKKSIIKYYTAFGNILKETKHLKNASLSGFTPETLYQLLKKEDQFRMDEFRNLKSNIHKLDNENDKYLKSVLNKIIYYK